MVALVGMGWVCRVRRFLGRVGSGEFWLEFFIGVSYSVRSVLLWSVERKVGRTMDS